MDLHIKVSSILQTFPSYREPKVREVALSNILEREKHGSFPLQSQGASRKGHSRNKTLLCHLKETAISAASLGRGPEPQSTSRSHTPTSQGCGQGTLLWDSAPRPPSSLLHMLWMAWPPPWPVWPLVIHKMVKLYCFIGLVPAGS